MKIIFKIINWVVTRMRDHYFYTKIRIVFLTVLVWEISLFIMLIWDNKKL
jgi:hypothetical protein